MEIIKDNKNINRIKYYINKIINYEKEIILFGSRSGSDYNLTSDYDVLVIVKKLGIKRRVLLDFQINIKRACAKSGIDIDLIVRDEDYSNSIKDYPGNIVNSAITSGIRI